MIIVDTSIWVAFFRWPDSPEAQEVRSLLRNKAVLMLGIIMGELLQGTQSEQETIALQEALDGPAYVEASKDLWREAGFLSARLRRQGRGIPLADALVAAIALRGNHEIYTLDEHFQRVPGLALHEVETA
jgi:predicted nucleic acid-binding protein